MAEQKQPTSPSLLIIDDDSAMQKYYTHALSAFDLQIDYAQNGYEGLRKITAHYYDLVLLDVSMPKMSGLEMLHAISEMPQMNLPLTVVISSLNQKELVMQALTYGASAYLFKPIDAGELKDLVDQYIGVLKEKTKGKSSEEAQASEPADPEHDAAQREVFSLENQQRKKSQYESLSQAMASMVFQKITGTLCVETQLGVGKLSYMRGKLKKVELLGQSGIEALEALKKLPALSITLEP
jgi:CheY-like chemotaxis protein